MPKAHSYPNDRWIYYSLIDIFHERRVRAFATRLRNGTVLINVDCRKHIVSEFSDRSPEFIDESIGMDGFAERIGRREAVTQFVDWVPDYTSRFGPFTEATASHWAVVHFLREEVGLSLDEINALSSPVTA